MLSLQFPWIYSMSSRNHGSQAEIVYHKSKYKIHHPENEAIKKWLYLVCVYHNGIHNMRIHILDFVHANR